MTESPGSTAQASDYQADSDDADQLPIDVEAADVEPVDPADLPDGDVIQEEAEEVTDPVPEHEMPDDPDAARR